MTDLLNRVQQLVDLLTKHRAHIERVLRLHNYSHDFDYIVQRVLSGEFDVYTPAQSLVLCEVVRYPNHSAYSIYLATGELGDLVDALPEIEAYATQLGTKYLALTGRPGWSRVLKSGGWVHDLSILHKEL